ncbi:hypothetical protein COY05_05340 [Candidatus Peregrinibacteria bacterium CG_4_10_14_0_2_um_filter_38_24]|nr:MAG: hypothetical protein COY05_05340 [Candidatus Peregrinibacteria bacterium CG_4_10_14_0_2_um_filter_38_24]
MTFLPYNALIAGLCVLEISYKDRMTNENGNHSQIVVKTATDGVVGKLKEATDVVTSRMGTEISKVIDATRMIGRRLIIGAIDTIDTFADRPEDQHQTPTESVLQLGARTARGGIALAKKARIIDEVNIQKLPRLLEDDAKDLLFKAHIVDILTSRFGTMSSFQDLIAFISNITFSKGIPAEKLTRFFESERIVKLLLQKVFDEESSLYRSPNLLAFAGSTMGIASKVLRARGEKREKKKTDEKTRAELDKKLNKFKANYRPESKYTISEFIKRLKEKYSEYDLCPWLGSRMSFFIEMLRGYKLETMDGNQFTRITGIKHIKNMVNGAYVGRTKNHNLHEEFIRTNLVKFFHVLTREQIPCFLIEIEELSHFFKQLEKIRTRESGEGKMIDLIKRICIEEIQGCEDMSKGITLLIHKDMIAEVVTISDSKDIPGKMAEIIDEAIKVSSPHINTTNLLVNPDGIPERIASEYDRIFDKEGQITQRKYHAMLRSIFEYADADQQKVERLNAIKKRINAIFSKVNELLVDASIDTGIKMPQEVEDILKINEYSELVKIACTEKNKRKRYAARLKIELTWLTYRGSYMPRFAFVESDSRKVKAKMEATTEDIQVDKDEPVEVIKFIDNKSGDPEVIGEAPATEGKVVKEGIVDIGELKLIPAKFAGQNCYLLHNGDNNSERGYINPKTLRSMVINRIRERSISFEEIQDMIRMTFVVDNMEELKALKESINTSHASLGRLVEVEDTYLESSENGTHGIDYNGSKSKKYRTLKYVSYVPISGEDQIYVVQFEIRVLLLEDAIKEKSRHHEIGHKAYEKRRILACIPILMPKEIFPELYEEEKDPDDIFEEVVTRVRQTLSSTASSESEEPKTLPEPSLPAFL